MFTHHIGSHDQRSVKSLAGQGRPLQASCAAVARFFLEDRHHLCVNPESHLLGHYTYYHARHTKPQH